MASHRDAPLNEPRQRADFRRALLAWFRAGARDLPWRRTRDPYAIWLSEVLLQQTRVETAVPYFERLVGAMPSVHHLAKAKLERVLKLWEGLGYYSRARNLHAAAHAIVKEHRGGFPETAAEWRNLPGVGDYTAAAVASIAFGEPVAAVDGNVKRVLARLYRVERSIDSSAVNRLLKGLAQELLAASAPGDFNQAVMELGARICVPRAPRCAQCPVSAWCAANLGGVQDELPVRRVRRVVPEVTEIAGAIRDGGRVLLARRHERGLLGGLWEFPATAGEPGATPGAQLEQFVRDQLGMDVTVERPLRVITHAFSHKRLQLLAHVCRHRTGRPRCGPYAAVKWVARSRVRRYPLTRVAQKVLAQL